MMRWAILMLTVLTIRTNAFAQSDRPRGSAAIIVGSSRTWDDEGNLGNGVAAGARIDWELLTNTRIEGAIEYYTHDRSGQFFESEGHGSITDVSLLQRFSHARSQPYVLGGINLFHHDGTTRVGDLTARRQSYDPGFHFGGGVAVRVGERMEIGPEARFFIISAENDSDPAWAYWIGVRAGVRF
jgi:hypothetical protein